MTPATFQTVRHVTTWVVAAAFGFYVLRQARKPHGWLGRRMVRTMNLTHSGLTDWGLGGVEIAKDATILDVGCGGGRTLQKLAERTTGKLFGADFSKASVATTLASNARTVAEGRMDVRHASVSQLPFDDATFDLVTAIETHYYWPDLAHDLAEVRRVLKPGGTAVLIAEVYRRPGSAIESFALKLMSGVTLSPDEHRAALEKAGFGDVRVETQGGWIRVIGRNVAPVSAPPPSGARGHFTAAGSPR